MRMKIFGKTFVVFTYISYIAKHPYPCALMKKLFTLSATISLLLLLCACSQRTKRSEHEEVLPRTRLEAALALFPHLIADSANTRYYLDISREEAAALGVSDEHYDEMIESIESSNRFLQEALKRNPDLHINWETPMPPTSRADVLPPDTTNPKSLFGLQTDYNDEEACRGFWADGQIQGVKFYCLGKSALVCTHVCKMQSMGRWLQESAVGTCLWNTALEIHLLANNTNATACFSTSDPNGGRAAVEAL